MSIEVQKWSLWVVRKRIVLGTCECYRLGEIFGVVWSIRCMVMFVKVCIDIYYLLSLLRMLRFESSEKFPLGVCYRVKVFFEH